MSDSLLSKVEGKESASSRHKEEEESVNGPWMGHPCAGRACTDLRHGTFHEVGGRVGRVLARVRAYIFDSRAAYERNRARKTAKVNKLAYEDDGLGFLIAQVFLIAMSFGLIGLVAGLIVGATYPIFGEMSPYIFGVVCWVVWTFFVCYFLAKMSSSGMMY